MECCAVGFIVFIVIAIFVQIVGHKTCPYCKKTVQFDASICPYCRSGL